MLSKPRKGTGKQIPTFSGPMFACIIDMSYLLWARAIDIRTLQESQIGETSILIKPSKTEKTSGKAVEILITPAIRAVIERAKAVKKEYKVGSVYLFPTRKGTPYAKSGLISMWDRAKERIGMDADITFKDLRSLAATDAAKSGEIMEDIKTRLAHTSTQTSEIYIKEVVAGKSNIDMALPWEKPEDSDASFG
jgi:integrase